MNSSNALPLIFEFTEEAFSPTFSARIKVRGRALVIQDEGETHLLGLDPAGASGGGDDLQDAWRDFRGNFKKTIEDIGYLTDGFDAFKQMFLELMGRAPEHMETQWAEAVQRVKSKDESELELRPVSKYSTRGIEIQPLSDGSGKEEAGLFALAA